MWTSCVTRNAGERLFVFVLPAPSFSLRWGCNRPATVCYCAKDQRRLKIVMQLCIWCLAWLYWSNTQSANSSSSLTTGRLVHCTSGVTSSNAYTPRWITVGTANIVRRLLTLGLAWQYNANARIKLDILNMYIFIRINKILNKY